MQKSFLLFSKCINQLKNRTTAKQQLYCQITIIFGEHFLCLKRPSLINYTDGIFLQIHMFRSIDQSLRPMGCMPRILLHLWAFLCIREAGHRGNKITALRFSIKKTEDDITLYNQFTPRVNGELMQKTPIPDLIGVNLFLHSLLSFLPRKSA